MYARSSASGAQTSSAAPAGIGTACAAGGMLRASAATRAASSFADSAATHRASTGPPARPPARTMAGTTRSRDTSSIASLLARMNVAIEPGSPSVVVTGTTASLAIVSNRESVWPVTTRRPPGTTSSARPCSPRASHGSSRSTAASPHTKNTFCSGRYTSGIAGRS